MPWYWDEGADPAAGTPGFTDGYNVNDNHSDSNGDGVDDTLDFQDFPGGPDGTSVTFDVWLVSLNADGSFHSFHDGAIEWTYSDPVGPTGPSSSIDLSLVVDPTTAQYEDLVDPLTTDFTTSVPTRVWDTVINNGPNPVGWSEGLWTRDGRVIGTTFPGGIVQPGAPPPRVNSDHIDLPETPNDFHFAVTLDGVIVTDVWAFWDTTQDPGLFFDFDAFTIPGTELQVVYLLDEGALLVQDVDDPSNPIDLYNGPFELFDPATIGATSVGQNQVEIMPEIAAPQLIGDYNCDGFVNSDDLDLVLANWGVNGLELPAEWVKQRPVFGQRGNFFGTPVGSEQLDAVLLNWGQQLGDGGAELASVPEPSAFGLLAVMSLVAVAWRRGAARCSCMHSPSLDQ